MPTLATALYEYKRYNVRILRDALGSKGYSRQLGAQMAIGAYVLFVDSDAELIPGCMTNLRRELEERNCAGVNARILGRENVSYWQRMEDDVFSRSRVNPEALHWFVAVVMFRRRALLKCSFDAHFSDSCEDLDFCRRLTANGGRVCLSNSAYAYHHYKRELSDFARKRFCYGLGSAQMYMKYRGMRSILRSFGPRRFLMALLTNRARLVPFVSVDVLTRSLGLMVGLSKFKGSTQGNSR